MSSALKNLSSQSLCFGWVSSALVVGLQHLLQSRAVFLKVLVFGVFS